MSYFSSLSKFLQTTSLLSFLDAGAITQTRDDRRNGNKRKKISAPRYSDLVWRVEMAILSGQACLVKRGVPNEQLPPLVRSVLTDLPKLAAADRDLERALWRRLYSSHDPGIANPSHRLPALHRPGGPAPNRDWKLR
ncbi:hypothetical protein [Andreprevotia chitinilytica]|uniref:hypothetical protein n=1 Tax=Andreprevotia chitinilytica TaxID=396808 RepID=UPI00054DE927|nr:hypothetical protein [Andreprevotia chitinilytica]